MRLHCRPHRTPSVIGGALCKSAFAVVKGLATKARFEVAEFVVLVAFLCRWRAVHLPEEVRQDRLEETGLVVGACMSCTHTHTHAHTHTHTHTHIHHTHTHTLAGPCQRPLTSSLQLPWTSIVWRESWMCLHCRRMCSMLPFAT